MRPSPGPHIEVAWLDSLEHEIIFDRIIAFSEEFIPVHEHGDKDFYLASNEVCRYAYARSHRKWDIGSAVSILDPLGIPSICEKLSRIVPYGRIVVKMVDF